MLFFFVHLFQNLDKYLYEKINWAFMLLMLTTVFACSNDEQALQQETEKTTSSVSQNSLGNYVASNLQNSTFPTRTWRGDRQEQTVAEQDEYSEVFIDLMDNYNQSTSDASFPNEIVTGYTLHQIQSSLNTSRTVNDFFSRLRSMHNNPTENNLQPIQDYANTIVNSL